jgi:ribosomal protein L37E
MVISLNTLSFHVTPSFGKRTESHGAKCGGWGRCGIDILLSAKNSCSEKAQQAGSSSWRRN